jgi:hypothetical protein
MAVAPESEANMSRKISDATAKGLLEAFAALDRLHCPPSDHADFAFVWSALRQARAELSGNLTPAARDALEQPYRQFSDCRDDMAALKESADRLAELAHDNGEFVSGDSVRCPRCKTIDTLGHFLCLDTDAKGDVEWIECTNCKLHFKIKLVSPPLATPAEKGGGE